MTGPLYLSANGARVPVANVLIPYYGAPVADVMTAADAPLSGSVSLVVGNMTLSMRVLRQAPFAGSLTARLVGGAGGWGREVGARSYALPSGVPLSMVLRDVAAEVGETLVLAADRSVGLFYVREACPAQRVLRQLSGESWYVDTAGVTRVGARASSRITTAATVVEYVGGNGWLSVATEDIAAWMPGATFSSSTVTTPITVSATRIAAQADGTLRLEVLTT